MGKVYSPEQVRDSENTIPSTADFEYAVDSFSRAVQAEIDDGNVSGAIIYGSVAIKSYTIRSDFDCMIVPPDHSRRSLDAITRVLEASNPSRRIDMSAIVHPRPRLERGAHEIDRYFGDHLSGSSRIVYGEDPASYIRFPDYGAFTHLISYVRHKKRSVATGFMQEGADYYKGLQRILELPLAIGRKALLVLDELSDTQLATADSANKSRIIPASLDLFDSFGLGDTPRAVIQLDRIYSDTLRNTLEGSVSYREYNEVLTEIGVHGEYASRWLDSFDEALGEYDPSRLTNK